MNAPELIDVGTLDRGSYLGGGDIAAIMGVHPYRTPLDVYLSKTGQAPPAKPDPERDKRLKRGHLWEPIVVDMLREEYGIEIVARNHRYVDPEFLFMAAEIDFEWRDADRTLRNGEIKTVHPLAAGKWGQAETEEIPIEHAAQSMWGLMVTPGRELCQYGVLFGADDLTLYHVHRDDETIANMRAAALTFWHEHVLAREAPAPRTFGDLAKLWPKDKGTSIEATPEVEAWLTSLATLKRRGKVANEGIEAMEFLVEEFIKDHATITKGGEPLATYKHQSSVHVAVKELKAALPEVYKQFARTTEFRVLKLK